MDKLLDEYREKFGECFPLMLCRTMSDNEITQTVQKCLDDGNPYDPDLNPDADY